MGQIVDQLHEQRLSRTASAGKRDYRRHIEWDHPEVVVREQFLEVARHRLGIWIFVNDYVAFAGRDLGERLRLRSAAPGGTRDHEPAILDEIPQHFALGRGRRVELDGNERAELR